MPYSKHPPNYQHLADISHRADALTSLVALTSILGSSFGGYTFLDPLGGLAVSFFILQQGLSLSKVAMLELLDAGVDKPTQKKIELLVEGLVDGKDLLGVRNVRGVKSGGTLIPSIINIELMIRSNSFGLDYIGTCQYDRPRLSCGRMESKGRNHQSQERGEGSQNPCPWSRRG
jgi:hypothetical protein